MSRGRIRCPRPGPARPSCRRRRPDTRTTPTNTTGSIVTNRRAGRSFRTSQASTADEEHLEVAEHGRDPGANVGDRVVPQHQVDRQEQAGQHGIEAVLQRPRPAAALFGDRQRDQRGQRQRAPVERGRRWPDVRQRHQDRRRRYARRAQRGPDRRAASGGPRGCRGGGRDALDVRTVSSYGTDMSTTLGGPADSSQSHFDADQLEAMAGCAELINSGRSADGTQLDDVAGDPVVRGPVRVRRLAGRAARRDLAAPLPRSAQRDRRRVRGRAIWTPPSSG